MAVPDFQEFFLPLLRVVGDGAVWSNEAIAPALAAQMQLDEPTLAVLSNNGLKSKFYDRWTWAKTYLDRAGLISYPAKMQAQITPEGASVLASGVTSLALSDLMQFPSFIEFHTSQKTKQAMERLSKAIEATEPFEPTNLVDARKRILASIVRRQGQYRFRKVLLAAYRRSCCVTGCDTEAVLDAAHIVPYKGPETNHVQNGLLLRSDLLTLFDLGLIAIDTEDYSVLVSLSLMNGEYGLLAGKKLRLPKSKGLYPSKVALDEHREASST